LITFVRFLFFFVSCSQENLKVEWLQENKISSVFYEKKDEAFNVVVLEQCLYGTPVDVVYPTGKNTLTSPPWLNSFFFRWFVEDKKMEK
jgi:hypothetical protein